MLQNNNTCRTNGETQVADRTPEVYLLNFLVYYNRFHVLFLGGELDCREGN